MRHNDPCKKKGIKEVGGTKQSKELKAQLRYKAKTLKRGPKGTAIRLLTKIWKSVLAAVVLERLPIKEGVVT